MRKPRFRIFEPRSPETGAGLFCERVLTVGKADEHGILKVDCDSRVFHIPLALHALDYFLPCQHAALRENSSNDVAHDTGLVSPLLECVKSASNEYEATVLDKLVVGRRWMRFAGKKLLNALCHLLEVHRRTVPLQREVREVAGVLDAHMRGIHASPLSERILSDTLGDGEPAHQPFRRTVLNSLLLQMLYDLFNKFLFRS